MATWRRWPSSSWSTAIRRPRAGPTASASRPRRPKPRRSEPRRGPPSAGGGGRGGSPPDPGRRARRVRGKAALRCCECADRLAAGALPGPTLSQPCPRPAQIGLSFAPVVRLAGARGRDHLHPQDGRGRRPALCRGSVLRAVLRRDVRRSARALGCGPRSAPASSSIPAGSSSRTIMSSRGGRDHVSPRRPARVRGSGCSWPTRPPISRWWARGGAELPALALARVEALEVGDLVLAIGNPFGVGQTVTSGIVSGPGAERPGRGRVPSSRPMRRSIRAIRAARWSTWRAAGGGADLDPQPLRRVERDRLCGARPIWSRA